MGQPSSPSTARRLGEVLDIERIRAGLSQRQLADASGLSLSTVNRLVRGETVVDLDQLERLARVFDVKPSVLVRLAEVAA